MDIEDEITLEITDFCREHCKFCSTNATADRLAATFLPYETIRRHLEDRWFKRIIISGGEPLAHSGFYAIYELCEMHADSVVVYSNLITHRIYNALVIDGVRVDAALTVSPDTQAIHVLKRVEQGREARRPEVTFSRNHDGPCDCNNTVMLANGTVAPTPCRKEG